MHHLTMGARSARRWLLLVCCLGLPACGGDSKKAAAAVGPANTASAALVAASGSATAAAVPDSAASAALMAAAASCQPAPRPAAPPASPPPCTVTAKVKNGTTACALQVRDLPRLVAGPDGLATATFTLCNLDTAAAPLVLSASDFITTGWDGQPFAVHSSRKLRADNPAEQVIVDGQRTLAAGACIAVRLDVGGLSQAGAMTAMLRQGSQDLAPLTALRTVMPLALKVEGANPAKIDLSLVKGGSAVVRLHNDDVVTYRLRWRLELAGRNVSGCLSMPPQRSQPLTLALDDAAFDWSDSGFIRPAYLTGRLVLERDVDPELANLPLAPLQIPVSATLRYHGAGWQLLANLSFVALFLLLGILGSLGINYALPMQRQRVALKHGLASHEDSLNSQGDLIGSRPLNVLRVELGRLRAAVGAQWPFLPETEAELPRIEARLGALQKRIDLARYAGKLLAEVRDPAALAVHEAQVIGGHCAAALRTVQLASPTEVDLQAAQTRLDAAAAVVDASAAPPDAAALAALAARAEQVKPSLGALPADPGGAAATPTDIATWQTLEDLLTDLRTDFTPVTAASTAAAAGAASAAPLSRTDYVQAAEAVWKAETLEDFAAMLLNAESPTVYRRRLDRAQDLLLVLLPGPQHSAQGAYRLLREIRQNVSKADVLAAVQAPAGAGPTIVVEPPTPTEYQLTVLRVSLPAPGLDVAEARRTIACKWAVDGREIPGHEFLAHHFFEWRVPRSKTFTVSVTLLDGTKPLATPAPVRVTLTRGPLLRSSTWLSLAGMATTIVVVIFGLFATAQEKLLASDVSTGLFALLVLGFGADVLKRVLSRP